MVETWTYPYIKAFFTLSVDGNTTTYNYNANVWVKCLWGKYLTLSFGEGS